MHDSYVLAIDQGTSSTKAIIFNAQGDALFKASEPLITHYLDGNRVEQEPEAIYQNVLVAVEQCLRGFKETGGNTSRIKACGISNQRETFVLWDKQGQPLYNAVVWQCKRSVEVCERLKTSGLENTLSEKTGLIIDPYFSGTKVMWLYENESKVRQAINSGQAFFGTVDTWLLYKMTGGRAYLTDYTNASRTMFFNLNDKKWDRELLAGFGLSGLHLPEVKPSSFTFGQTRLGGLLDQEISISAMIGDSHAAAFGEGCFEPGTAKATLGTGSSILMNIGDKPKPSAKGMITTICWSTADRVDYALEGIIVSSGATIEWVKNQLGLFQHTDDLEGICRSLSDNGGVYIIPAFSGLGAPHWEMSRKASIEGLTFDSTKDHVIRAAVESVSYQIKDVISAMESDSGQPLSEVKIDGGITANKFVVQFLADLLGKRVTNIRITDVSALGAAYLAGLNVGIYESIDQLKTFNMDCISTEAGAEAGNVQEYYEGWKRVIGR